MRFLSALRPVSDWPRSAWLLIAVNLVPLAGALFLGWRVLDILLLFWIENAVIGAANVVRLLAAASRSGGRWPGSLFLAGFFTLHYGGFTVAHGVAVLSLFGDRGAGVAEWSDLWPLLQTPGMALAVAALAFSHAASLVLNDFRAGELWRQDKRSLMTRPYRRVVMMHLAILLGGLAVSALGAPIWALVVLVALKVVMDLGLHLREHRGHRIMKAAG